MLRLAWLPIAQHVFQPALTGRLELISRKIVSSEQEQRLSRWADFAKNCLPRIECKELPRFHEKYRALGRHVCKIREIGGQKNGVQHATAIYPIPRYTRPRYIGLTLYCANFWYLQTSNINGTVVDIKFVDHADAFGASPLDAAPTTSSFSTLHLAMNWVKTNARWDEKQSSVEDRFDCNVNWHCMWYFLDFLVMSAIRI